MSDGSELPTPVEFDLEPVITFNAADVARNLSALQIVELIKELDGEMNEWEGTVLLASYFSAQLAAAPEEYQAMTDEQLTNLLEILEDMEKEAAK